MSCRKIGIAYNVLLQKKFLCRFSLCSCFLYCYLERTWYNAFMQKIDFVSMTCRSRLSSIFLRTLEYFICRYWFWSPTTSKSLRECSLRHHLIVIFWSSSGYYLVSCFLYSWKSIVKNMRFARDFIVFSTKKFVSVIIMILIQKAMVYLSLMEIW